MLDDPPIDLRSHPVTATLLDEPTPLVDRAAKHREDLLDAVLCVWTGLLWWHHGLTHCQVLGGDESRRRRSSRRVDPSSAVQCREVDLGDLPAGHVGDGEVAPSSPSTR